MRCVCNCSIPSDWLLIAETQRVALLEVWKTFEEKHGTLDSVAKVEAMKPIISK